MRNYIISRKEVSMDELPPEVICGIIKVQPIDVVDLVNLIKAIKNIDIILSCVTYISNNQGKEYYMPYSFYSSLPRLRGVAKGIYIEPMNQEEYTNIIDNQRLEYISIATGKIEDVLDPLLSFAKLYTPVKGCKRDLERSIIINNEGSYNLEITSNGIFKGDRSALAETFLTELYFSSKNFLYSYEDIYQYIGEYGEEEEEETDELIDTLAQFPCLKKVSLIGDSGDIIFLIKSGIEELHVKRGGDDLRVSHDIIDYLEPGNVYPNLKVLNYPDIVSSKSVLSRVEQAFPNLETITYNK